MLLQNYADGFSRLEMPLDMLEETLSILFMFHDPTGSYSLPMKMAELNARLKLDSLENPEGHPSAYREFYDSVVALVQDIDREENTGRAVNRLTNLSEALILLHGTAEGSAKKVCKSWLAITLSSMIKRFAMPMESPGALEAYINKTFDPTMASLILYAISLSGKLEQEDETPESDLVLVVSLLILLTSKVNTIRMAALDLMARGEISPEETKLQ